MKNSKHHSLLSSRRRNNMKLLVGLFIAGLLVSESHGRLRRSIFRKCQQSGVTFPTCEAGERLGYFRNTCDEVVSGNFGKFSFLWRVSLGSIRVLQVPPGSFKLISGSLRCTQCPLVVFRVLKSPSGAFRVPRGLKGFLGVLRDP